MKKKKEKLVPIAVLPEDRKKLKKWSAQREMKMYEIVSLLINKK